jgi:hypothetical protein
MTQRAFTDAVLARRAAAATVVDELGSAGDEPGERGALASPAEPTNSAPTNRSQTSSNSTSSMATKVRERFAHPGTYRGPVGPGVDYRADRIWDTRLAVLVLNDFGKRAAPGRTRQQQPPVLHERAELPPEQESHVCRPHRGKRCCVE